MHCWYVNLENKIIYDDVNGQSEVIKGIILKSEINNKAIGKVKSSS